MKRLLFLLMVIVALTSCNEGSLITTEMPPEIIIDNTSGVYTTKVDRPITITPQYKYVEDALYQWSVEGYDGYIQSVNEPSFTFTSSEVGSYYVQVKVTTDYGTDREEVRIDVVDLEIPTISMMGTQRDYTIQQGYELMFAPTVKATSIPTTYCWTLNGVMVSEELTYTFCSEELGDYVLAFAAENEDGRDEVVLNIRVCTPDQMPFSWRFDQTTYNYAIGRSIRIMPAEVVNGEGAVYSWVVDGVTMQEGNSSTWICDLAQEGAHRVQAIATVVKDDVQITVTQELEVNVCAPEGTYRRAAHAASSALWNKVYEYTPAPGQFINETATGGFDGTQTTAEAACLYAEQRMLADNWVSLGGFGGYIVVGFDHSIANNNGYDFAVKSNCFTNSSEPGVVWVMQDENGDGLPNDTWYELRGSESGAATTIQDYAITYYRPEAAGMPVQWSDNQGNNGQIEYLAAFHSQDYYYPMWVEADAYTLRGTLLESRCYDKSGNGSYWVLPEYDWGYVDNYSATDCNREGDKANTFDISNAVNYAGQVIALQYVDFVKVQTAVNAQCGWIGENSTEVTGMYDCGINN